MEQLKIVVVLLIYVKNDLQFDLNKTNTSIMNKMGHTSQNWDVFLFLLSMRTF